MTFEKFRNIWLDKSECVACHTSGSTGTPKTILLPKSLMRLSAHRTNSFFGINSSSRLHCCVAPRFIGGKMMMVRALEAGARITWESPSNRPLGEEAMHETIDLLAVVPSQMIHICRNLHKLPKIKNVIIGGSAISDNIRDTIIKSGIRAYETYGMTETASHIALRVVTDDPESPFIPLDGVKIRSDDSKRLVICDSGFPEIITNDIAAIYPGGGFRIVGRIDDVIVTGAMKVHPAELERKVQGLFECRIAIGSVPDPKWNRALVLVLESNEGIFPSEGETIITMLRDYLEPQEMPKRIECMTRLPITEMGKLDRKKLDRLLLQKST